MNKLENTKVLVTGNAGFIGMHVVIHLAEMGYQVVGIDNINSYYSVNLKYSRLLEQGINKEEIEYNKKVYGKKRISFLKLDITDSDGLKKLFEEEQFSYVVHLAAQAGVRYSIENPHAYIQSNVTGFLEILENCKNFRVKHLVYASSSSVYGINASIPFQESDKSDQQVSFYAATKKANESMAHSFASIHKLPVSGLRFFTVYGPYGRPDMAIFKFTDKILKGECIDVYNNGELSRDFTYIDDIVKGIVKLIPFVPNDAIPAQIFNIGRGEPIPLMAFIKAIEDATGMEGIYNYLPMQKGDVERTWADTTLLQNLTGYKPQVEIGEGVPKFVEWFRNHYNQ